MQIALICVIAQVIYQIVKNDQLYCLHPDTRRKLHGFTYLSGGIQRI